MQGGKGVVSVIEDVVGRMRRSKSGGFLCETRVDTQV